MFVRWFAVGVFLTTGVIDGAAQSRTVVDGVLRAVAGKLDTSAKAIFVGAATECPLGTFFARRCNGRQFSDADAVEARDAASRLAAAIGIAPSTDLAASARSRTGALAPFRGVPGECPGEVPEYISYGIAPVVESVPQSEWRVAVQSLRFVGSACFGSAVLGEYVVVRDRDGYKVDRFVALRHLRIMPR